MTFGRDTRSQSVNNAGKKAHRGAASILERNVPPLKPGKESKNPDKSVYKQAINFGQCWRTVSVTVGFFIAGTMLAVGHHCFYNNLDGTIVPANVDENWDLSSQQWKLRIGTALAFLVKVCFTISVETAYTQMVWTHVRARNRPLGSLDALFSGTTDPSVFFNIEYLTRSRFVALIASICWYGCCSQAFLKLTSHRLLPLVVIITPATLNVVPSQNVTTAWTKVPNIALHWDDSAGIDTYFMQGSSDIVSPTLSRLASTTATARKILPMDLMFP